MKLLATLLLGAMNLCWPTYAVAQQFLFCTAERGVGDAQQEPELNETLLGWRLLITTLSEYDSCGSEIGRVIRHELLLRLSRCPATERQAAVERCILEMMLQRVDGPVVNGTCGDVARSRGVPIDELRRQQAQEGPAEFWRYVKTIPSADRLCF